MSLEATLPARSRFSPAIRVVPGLMLTAMLAALGTELHALPVLRAFSPLILSILLGIAFHNVIGTPQRARAGVAFAMRRILRLGIILLGFQISAAQVAAIGLSGVAIIVASLIATMAATKAIGRWLGVEPKLAELIAAGTSICGASAVIATNTVTKARDEDVAYAIACITIFGSAAMFLYPVAGAALQLSAYDYGLWSGVSIHEIAQVVAAAFQRGPEAGQFGTVAKLTRVMMLAPMILALGWSAMRHNAHARAKAGGSLAGFPVPWFVFGFVALVALNSLVSVDPSTRATVGALTNFLLAMALAAMGLGTDFRKLVAAGLRPLMLGAIASLFISGFSLALVAFAR